jgi:hypothetical protein
MFIKPREGIVRSMLAKGTLAALLGMTLGCGASPPAGPTPTPVTPAPVTPSPSGVYTVTAGTNVVGPGGPLSVTWSTSAAGHNDWIALFKKGDPNTAHSWWEGWTDGATSGTFTLRAPSQAGQYEFRYLLDDGFSDAAVSTVVTVGAVAEHAYNRGP